MKKLAELSVLGALSLATSLALVACGGGGGEGAAPEGASATASAGNAASDAAGGAGVTGVAPTSPTSPISPSSPTSVLPSSTAFATAGSTAVDAAGPAANTPSIATANSTAAPSSSVVYAEPAELTVPEYLARRNTGVITATDPFPDAAALAALAAANRKLAVEQLAFEMARAPGVTSFTTTYSPINAVAVPALSYALVRDLTAASSGDTLAQIKSSGLGTAPVQYVATLQTSRVNHQFWADRGQRFRTGFFQSTDTFGPWPRLKAWSAAETDFASGGFKTDPALISALAEANVNFTVGSLPTSTANVRALVATTVSERANWGAVTPFDGVFDRAHTLHDLVRMPMVRVTTGVKRFAGTDFTADVLPMPDGLQLITLRPQVGNLQDYRKARLNEALEEAIQGLLASGAKPGAGEMVLPKVDIDLPIDTKAPIYRAGIRLPFDEVNANLRSLDGLGGTYAVPVFSGASLSVSNDGLTLKAADATAFTFSPKNIFGPGYTSLDSTLTVVNLGPYSVDFDLFTCTWPKPDMRSFFMVILDSKRWVVSLAAIEAPPGTDVVPTRTSYNPWVNVPEMVLTGDMRGAYLANNMTSSVSAVPPVDVLGQTNGFGFHPNRNLYNYAHETCLQTDWR